MKAQAFVKDRKIDLNPFVEQYVGNVFSGVAASLRGVHLPKRLEFAVEGNRVTITADNVPIELAGFAELIVADTVNAALKHLKGLSPGDPVRIIIEA